MKGYLVLENGRVFEGKLLNDCSMANGEVVFSTAMISYQDIITDPSYFGQIVVMTYPLVGNVGFNEKSFSSRLAMVKGLVLREATDFPSHYEMEMDLISFLNESEIPVLTEVDTRALTKFIRSEGIMGGIITHNIDNKKRLINQAKKASEELTGDLVRYVTRKNVMKYSSGQKRIVLLDLGTKRGALESLIKRGLEIIAVPATYELEDIMSLKPEGVFISDGPGDPEAIKSVIETTRDLIGKLPIFGVGLGHQVLALALGAKTFKLAYGHRGTNHPVKDLSNNRVYITTQNHGYAVLESSINHSELEITLRSLNDNSLEGIKHKNLPVFSVQFDPEGFPGYSETGFFYDKFVELL
ncbi:Carbamoyl-phosphate synthase small chain [Candidatus Syntrophocurvum alkaliphilum]|uniref:Carbamoyl phosphate synthase small chain n=1 Tax=Candidatus Syntrophocurvum alkaliphilum TaxID=2293317 RepID=A0A6I6D9Y9_9FIRM|nr:glutamine-hydrolyzing carbamoyl-phosphate synthase small subunit [Candidatus Syntrophocurvum alkaliphilum]QGT99668.1 Carbamoyl-phosphate synthase small chain [Candidatus Syntrophocurvum alkaliphilum]